MHNWWPFLGIVEVQSFGIWVYTDIFKLSKMGWIDWYRIFFHRWRFWGIKGKGHDLVVRNGKLKGWIKNLIFKGIMLVYKMYLH